jgi:hypothetical protein
VDADVNTDADAHDTVVDADANVNALPLFSYAITIVMEGNFFSLPPSLRDNISENSEFSEMLSRREGEEAREGASGLEKNIRKTISSRRTNERTTPMVMAMLIPMPYVDAHANAICRC